MKKHTKEPWTYVPSTEAGSRLASIHCGDNTVFTVSSHRADGGADANANRIVDCVNAMAGVDDPLAFMEAAMDLLNACKPLRHGRIDINAYVGAMENGLCMDRE